MGSDQAFIEYIASQIDESCEFSWRMMFGGCTLYSKGKVVGLICDGQLFIKPTAPGKAFIGEPVEAPPYKGAKDAYLIENKLDDKSWLTELIKITEAALPAPKPRGKKRK